MLTQANQANSRLKQHSYSQQQLGHTSKLNQSTTIINSHHSALAFKSKSPFSIAKKCHTPCCNSISSNTANQSTFTPEIHPLPFDLFPKEWSHNVSRQEHWQMLIKDTRQRNRIRSEQKLKQQQSALQQCTFVPRIINNSNETDQNIFDRLHEDSYKRRANQLEKEQEVRKKEKEQILQKMSANKQAKPKILLNKQKYDLGPLYTRLQEVIRQKKQNRKLVAQRQTNEYKFQPSINRTSNQIINKKQHIANVVDRLLEEHRNKTAKINQLRQKYDKIIQKQLTFSPQINNYMPIEELTCRQKVSNKYENYSFQPEINQLSELITQDRKFQTKQEKLYRLHNTPVLQKAEKLTFIQAEVYAQCHFNPEINHLSKLLTHSSHKNHNCPIPQKEVPSYHPKINQTSQYLSQDQRAKSLQLLKLKAKEKAVVYTKQNEYREMKQCSFRPKILRNQEARLKNTKNMSVAQIAGFNDYYKHVENLHDKERQKKMMEQKLFSLQKQYDQRMNTTKKQPTTSCFKSD